MPSCPKIQTVTDGARWTTARKHATAEGQGIGRALELYAVACTPLSQQISAELEAFDAAATAGTTPPKKQRKGK